jgi:hypothetical protein
LLRAAEAAGFDVLLTTDKSLAFQQNLKGRKIAIVVLGNPQWPVARGRRTGSREQELGNRGQKNSGWGLGVREGRNWKSDLLL